MPRGRNKRRAWLSRASYCALTLLCFDFSLRVFASESPDRMCCELPEKYRLGGKAGKAKGSDRNEQASSKSDSRAPSKPVLNCMTAQELCTQHDACNEVLKLLPRLCGTKTVACSSVTVEKCKAALRMLRAFPFFQPTCLCKEPTQDPICNAYRIFIFDHPCTFVKQKEYMDPYQAEALPMCDYALETYCYRDGDCADLYRSFREICSKPATCAGPEKSRRCMDMWRELRLSPLYGCICPEHNAKRSKCRIIQDIIMQNPCVEKAISESWQYQSMTNVRTIFTEIRGRSAVHSPWSPLLPFLESSRVPTSSIARRDRRTSSLQPASTCTDALEKCLTNPACKKPLQVLLQSCDPRLCSLDQCRDALAEFFSVAPVDMAMEVAFCTCLEDDAQCENSLYRFFPSCYYEIPENRLQSCQSIARRCSESESCSVRLNAYIQSCAEDSLTNTCSAKAGQCRLATLYAMSMNLMGACSCFSTYGAERQECIEWKYILLENPCVEESQMNYQLPRITSLSQPSANAQKNTGLDYDGHDDGFGREESSLRRDSLRTANGARHPGSSSESSSNQLPVGEGLSRRQQQQIPASDNAPAMSAAAENSAAGDVAVAPAVVAATTASSTSSSSSTQPSTTSSTTTVTTTTTTPPTTTTTTPTTTTTTIPTTTRRPLKNCTFVREDETIVLYEEYGMRFFEDGVYDECSVLCMCSTDASLTCTSIGCPGTEGTSGCRSPHATYAHNARAYSDEDELCICHNGRFLCARPKPGLYPIPPTGQFLFLGFSRKDESLLAPHTGRRAFDIVPYLQELVDPQELCKFSLYNISRQNIILRVEIRQGNSNRTYAAVFKQCKADVNRLIDWINDRKLPIRSHHVLSMLRLAEARIQLSLNSASPLTRSHLWHMHAALLAILARCAFF